MNPQKKNNGFLYVSSLDKRYFSAAYRSAKSLKRFYPEAKIAMFTHGDWIEKKHENLFDFIYDGVPLSRRAKLWALSKTPFDQTLYIDSDTNINSPEIQNVFSEMKDNDIVFNTNIQDIWTDLAFYGDQYIKNHAGIFLYNKKSFELMDDWWRTFDSVKTIEDLMDFCSCDRSIAEKYFGLDQFILHNILLSGKYDHLKISNFEDLTKWNYYAFYAAINEKYRRNDFVVYHKKIK